MSEDTPDIVIVDRRIEPEELGIRPAQGNRTMLIADPSIRERVRDVTFALIGEGEPLP